MEYELVCIMWKSTPYYVASKDRARGWLMPSRDNDLGHTVTALGFSESAGMAQIDFSDGMRTCIPTSEVVLGYARPQPKKKEGKTSQKPSTNALRMAVKSGLRHSPVDASAASAS